MNQPRQLVDERARCRRCAANAAERDRAETEMSARIGIVLTTVEQYPEVKGSRRFTELRREMTDVENKIAATRRFFNMAVGEYATLAQFPRMPSLGWPGCALAPCLISAPNARRSRTPPPPSRKDADHRGVLVAGTAADTHGIAFAERRARMNRGYSAAWARASPLRG